MDRAANPTRTDEFRAGYDFGYGDGQVGEYNPDFGMRRYQANYILVEESFDGLAEVARRLLDAHREAYEAAYGPIPAGFVIHHHCEQRDCLEPTHLEAMSRADHIRLHMGDAKRLGRSEHTA